MTNDQPTIPNQPAIPEIPPEMKKKLEKIKSLIEKFKKEVLKKFDKYIVGIALLPPKRIEPENKEKINPDEFNVLILVDDSDSQKMSKEELRIKLFKVIEEIAEKIDDKLKPETLLMSELKESCYDGKYEILQMIATSGIAYDKGLLAALKVAEIHKSMTLKKFEKYIVSYVAAGSLFRGDSNPQDIDIYVVVDDTDVKKMARAELRDKLRAIISGMGFEAGKIAGVEAQFHVQTYILTDFWESIKDANPVIFTFLRDGVPLFDRGVFMPWKLLLYMGRIKPSPEAIDMNMELGEKLLSRIRFKLLSVVGEDLYYAALNPAQAALMLYGLPPPTPKETVKLLNEIFVKKEKLLEKGYVDILEKIRKTYKDVEHGRIKDIKGKEIDDLLKDVGDYLKRIQKLFSQIEKRHEAKGMDDIHDSCITVVRDAIRTVSEEKIGNIDNAFKKHLIEKGKMPEKMLKIFRGICKAKQEAKDKKLTKQEMEKTRKDARTFIKVMVDFIQRSRGLELERAKIKVKYEKDKFGEIILLDDVAFISMDLGKRDEIQKAEIVKDGSLRNVKKSSLEELEKHLAKIKIPERVFIKEKTFETLKELFGEKVQILVSY